MINGGVFFMSNSDEFKFIFSSAKQIILIDIYVLKRILMQVLLQVLIHFLIQVLIQFLIFGQYEYFNAPFSFKVKYI